MRVGIFVLFWRWLFSRGYRRVAPPKCSHENCGGRADLRCIGGNCTAHCVAYCAYKKGQQNFACIVRDTEYSSPEGERDWVAALVDTGYHDDDLLRRGLDDEEFRLAIEAADKAGRADLIRFLQAQTQEKK